MKQKNVYLFIIGRAVSLFGSGIFTISIPLFFLDYFSNEMNIGFFNTIKEVPAIILLPFLSVYIENTNKKNIMVYSDLFQGIIYSIMLILLLTNSLNIVSLLIICCIADVVTEQFSVATNVLFSEIVKDDELEKYNNIKSIVNNFIMVVAPTVGALMYTFFGMKSIILINILSFFGSAIIEYFIEYEFKAKEKVKLKLLMK